MHPSFEQYPASEPTYGTPHQRKRPSWIMPVVIIGVILVLLCGGCFAAIGLSGPDDTATGVISPTSSSQSADGTGSAKASPQKPSDGKLRADGWRLDTITFKDEYGLPTATARITNEDADSTSAIFEVTALTGENAVATFLGSADNIGKGKTTTVKFVGEKVGDWKASGKYNITFEKDL